MCAIPTLAWASDLVVGVVHDGDGYPVTGATVTLRAAGGASAGSGTTAADGTFGIDAAAAAASADVRCAYCVGVGVPVVAGKPVVVVVKRFAALRDHGISAGDARVLPYDNVTAVAALMPFTVTGKNYISDRGLANARGTIVADGLPLYRATDGLDLGGAVVPHSAVTITEADPAVANSYDARSSGGLFSIDTLDASGGVARIDNNEGLSGTLRGGNVLRGALSTSGGEYASSRLTGASTFNVANGTLDVRGVAASGQGSNANAFAASLAAPVRASQLNASLNVNRSVDPFGPENDTIAAVSLQHSGVTFGLRAQRSSGLVDFATGTQYDQRAYVEAVNDNGHTRLFASLAAAQTGDGITQLGTIRRSAILPIASVSTRIGGMFSVHADSVDALLPEPLYLLDSSPGAASVMRTHMLDAGVGFDDNNRVRVDLMAFRELGGGATAQVTAGSGVSTIWQIAPSLSLRAWVLISRQNAVDTTPYYSPGNAGGLYATSATIFDRNVVWLTAGNVLRVDAISHGGRLDGDVSVPAGSQFRIIAGTRRDGGGRIFSLGLALP